MKKGIFILLLLCLVPLVSAGWFTDDYLFIRQVFNTTQIIYNNTEVNTTNNITNNYTLSLVDDMKLTFNTANTTGILFNSTTQRLQADTPFQIDNYIIDNNGLYKTIGGYFRLGYNAQFPQIFIGNSTNTTYGIIDVANNKPLFIQSISGAATIFGVGGIMPETNNINIGNTTNAWNTSYIFDGKFNNSLAVQNYRIDSNGIYKTVGGFFPIGYNAQFPQIRLGNTSNTTYGIIDVANNKPLIIQSISGAATIFGVGGIMPEVNNSKIGNTTNAWNISMNDLTIKNLNGISQTITIAKNSTDLCNITFTSGIATSTTC